MANAKYILNWNNGIYTLPLKHAEGEVYLDIDYTRRVGVAVTLLTRIQKVFG